MFQQKINNDNSVLNDNRTFFFVERASHSRQKQVTVYITIQITSIAQGFFYKVQLLSLSRNTVLLWKPNSYKLSLTSSIQSLFSISVIYSIEDPRPEILFRLYKIPQSTAAADTDLQNNSIIKYTSCSIRCC